MNQENANLARREKILQRAGITTKEQTNNSKSEENSYTAYDVYQMGQNLKEYKKNSIKKQTVFAISFGIFAGIFMFIQSIYSNFWIQYSYSSSLLLIFLAIDISQILTTFYEMRKKTQQISDTDTNLSFLPETLNKFLDQYQNFYKIIILIKELIVDCCVFLFFICITSAILTFIYAIGGFFQVN